MDNSLIRKMCAGDEEYLRDESKKAGFADSISFPESEADIVNIVKELKASSTPLTIQGSRTGLAAAAVPFGGHILNLSKMAKVTGMRCSDDKFYITVQPGVILQKLNKSIAAKSFDTSAWSEEAVAAYKAFVAAPVQMFTPDPTETTATIGGMVACNASGAKSYRFGATREHISAIRGVLSNGETFAIRRGEQFAKGREIELSTEQGGKIKASLPTYKMPECKNASGYYCHDDMDLIDLFIGSDGTLAIITEIEVALMPLPTVVWGVCTFFEEQKQAVAYTQSLKKAEVPVASIEYFDACALDILRRQKEEGSAFAGLPTLEDNYKYAVFTELQCSAEEEAYELLKVLGESCAKAGGNPDMSMVSSSDSDRDTLYFFRHAVPESVNMQVERYKRIYPEITKIGGDLAVPDEHFETLLAFYDATLERENLHHAAWGHIGDNHIHVNILPRDMDEYKRGKAVLTEWAKEASRLGGAVSAEHGVGKLKAPFLEFMYGEEHIREMAKLKSAFDPDCALGRGNLFAETLI